MVDIVLVTDCDPETGALLDGVLEGAYVSHAPTVDEYLGLDPVLVVVGPRAPLPLVEAQRAYARFGAVHVLLLPPMLEWGAVQDEMTVTPGVQKSIRCLPATVVTSDPDRVRAALEAAVAAERAGHLRHEAHDDLEHLAPFH